MRIFAALPIIREPDGRARLYGRCAASIFNQRWHGQIDFYTPVGGDNYADPYETIVRKYSQAREVFLKGAWDYFWCVECDMVLPLDALSKLLALDVPIAYGLYCWRRQPYEWSAYTELHERYGVPISDSPTAARAAWGNVIDVAGIGQGCTLVKREVMEAIPYRYTKGVSSDWNFSLDALKLGVRQVCDLSVVLGHMTMTPSPCIIYPDVNEPKLHRMEFLG